MSTPGEPTEYDPKQKEQKKGKVPYALQAIIANMILNAGSMYFKQLKSERNKKVNP